MKIEIDTHTHTVLSGHAHSTLLENAAAAAKKGLYGFVLTDHGPSLPGAPPEFNIGTYPYIPSRIEGVRIYPGVEANIINSRGDIDISGKYIDLVDFVIAGMHEVVLPSQGVKLDTQAAIGALANKYIDIIAHPDNPGFFLDYEAVVKAASRYGKLLEVNDHSFNYRRGGIANAERYLKLCRKYGVRVAVSSDAHFASDIGGHDTALRILEKNNFPEELVVNATAERFESYLAERKKRLERAVCANN
ncbi:MAG: phosphatase [Christensenellales bacterium]